MFAKKNTTSIFYINMIRQITTLATLAASTICVYGQGTQGSISGKINNENGQAIHAVTVEVKNESTGFTTTTTTNEKGEFYFKQLPLGGPYTVIAYSVELGEQIKNGYQLNLGDDIKIDFSFNAGEVIEIKAVEIKGNSLKNTIKNIGSSTSVTAKDIERLPVNGRNFTSLIDLSPLSSGSNLSGQLASSTNFTIDGMTAKNPTSGGTTNRNGGPYAISMESVREFAVVTNAYDVTFGRSGGGTINTVTKSGTNTLAGSAFMFGRADWLSSPYDIRANKRDSKFSTYQYGFTLGGPIIKDKLHYFFAWDHQAHSSPLIIADIQNDADEARYNLSQSTLDRFVDIARKKYGVSSAPQFGQFDRKRGTDALFLRVDWQINDRNLLTLRNNYVNDRNDLGLGDNTTINLYEVFGDVKSIDNSFMASLRTKVNSKLTNELKVQHLYTSEESTPNKQLPQANIPRAIVERVQSNVGGRDVFTNIQIGGQRYSPENFYNHVFQITDNLYLNTEKVNYTFGTDLMYTNMNSLYGSEMNGRYYFTGMDNFNNLTPYRYAREVYLNDDQRVKQNILATGVYGQLQTDLAPGLELIAGLRLDYTHYFDKGNFNQLVYDELGLRTDNVLKTFQVQPRFQFTWDINENKQDIIRFGAGIFGSDINNYAMINNMVFDGTKVASIDVQGDLVPRPDFIGYRENPNSAPGAELFNNPNIQKISTINMNASDAKVPVVYKANTSYTHFFNSRFKVGAHAYMSLGRNNYMYIDRNMVDDPFFRITAEDNRGVYVPANTISKTNGATDWMMGRKSSKVGRVLEMVSDGKVNQFAFVLDGTYNYYKEGQISVSYTWNDTKDNTSYNGNVANSATLSLMVNDDPRNLSKMTYSDNHFRHKLVVYGTTPTFLGINAGIRFSAIGGTRYSLGVSGNVNGDFVNSNDLAYIYDINNPTTPTYIKEGIQTILDNPNVEKSTKKYIRDSYGKIAERNGGINGFYGYLDLRLSKKIKIVNKHSFEISADIFNVANLLNKEWGRAKNLGKQNIYSIKSFDSDKQEFVYNVNTNTGTTSYSGNPYQIQIGFRYAF